MRALFKIVCFILVLGLVVGCANEAEHRSELIDFIPEHTSLVLKFNDLEILHKDLKQNEALSQFKSSRLYPLLSGEHTIIKLFKSKGPGLLCINKRGDSLLDYTFITRQDSVIFQLDSLRDKTSETLTYNNSSIDRVTIENETVFTAVRDSIFLASSSQLLLQDILSGKSENRPDFRKAIEISRGKELMAVRSQPPFKILDIPISGLAMLTTLDITISPGEISAEGVALARDSTASLINVFKGQITQKNAISTVLPTDATSAVSFTFNNAASLISNLRAFRLDSVTAATTGLFETITEIGEIDFSEGKVILLNSIDAAATEEVLDPMLTENSSFRDVAVHNFSRPDIFIKNFAPLVSSDGSVFAFRLDQFFIFTESMALAEKMITAYKSNDVLKNTAYFKNSMQKLGDASSLLILHMNSSVSSGLANILFPEFEFKGDPSAIKKYPLSALQFSYDRDFAHMNYACIEANPSRQITGRVSQLMSKSLDKKILTPPQFFSNHRTGGLDMVIQDYGNTLHLIASNGKVLWSKQLEGPILGDVNEVDLLRNGKIQLAFATAKKFYILDRNGKDVAPFPISFKDAITQPLAVFDYDNNRNYRFAIVQSKEVLLYDSNGKVVKGFKFKKTNSPIVQPARHFRLSNKDYIVIAEENGTLHILSRVGSSRVNVSKSFKFSDIPITTEGSNFVVITSENTKESISQKGKVTSTKLTVSESYYFTTDARIKVTLDDNLMRIDGKLVELPFGIYTNPKIFRINRKTYISITEIQEKKVYIYDDNGVLLPGFPVYGTSTAALGDANKNGKLNLMVYGAANEIILYQLE